MAGVLSSRCDYVGPPFSASLIDYMLASHSARRVRVSEQSPLNERFYPPLLSLFARRSVPEARIVNLRRAFEKDANASGRKP
jgi:hypothetical protein